MKMDLTYFCQTLLRFNFNKCVESIETICTYQKDIQHVNMEDTNTVKQDILKDEDNKIRIRTYLHNNNIKLWEDTYNDDEQLKILAETIKPAVHCNLEQCVHILKELKEIAISRLSQRERFLQSGEATIRIKYNHEELSITCKLSESGSHLLELISNKINIPVNRLKIVFKGKIIKIDQNLEEQGVRNSSLLLLITLAGDPDSLKKDAEMLDDMSSTRRDAELLAAGGSRTHYLELEDQFGNIIKLPEAEKKALTVAVALHERGRTALKYKDYSRALLLLLHADNLYNECNAQLLKNVDNHGLLNLDIAWCYLHLKSVTHIPDASDRLKECEKKFHTTYGENFERVEAIKGYTGNEKALFLRLHLLQGVVLYYQNKREEAAKILKRVESQLNNLKINDENFTALLQMGYTQSESKLGLRACSNDISGAINFILRQRKEKDIAKKKATEERKDRLLGKCDDGKQYISSKLVDAMIGMGYNRATSMSALKKFNNHLSDAVGHIADQFRKLNEMPDKDKEFTHQLMTLGYDIDRAIKAMESAGGDIENFMVERSTLQQAASSSESKKMKEAQDAHDRLWDTIEFNHADDHLDLDLTDEENFLKSYLNLLN